LYLILYHGYANCVGRHSSWGQRPFLPEVVSSLPALNRRTSQQPPEDLPPEELREIRTGEDTDGVIKNTRHTLLGVAAWLGWMLWTVHLWFFVGAPFTDLWIVIAIWFVVFVVTIIGVPIMRRKARDRIHR